MRDNRTRQNAKNYLLLGIGLDTGRENGNISSLAGKTCKLGLARHVDTINSKRRFRRSSHSALRKLKGLWKTWLLLYVHRAHSNPCLSRSRVRPKNTARENECSGDVRQKMDPTTLRTKTPLCIKMQSSHFWTFLISRVQILLQNLKVLPTKLSSIG